MKTRFILLACIILQINSLSAFSQKDSIKLGRSFGLQISGFARADYIYDTRQTSEVLEGLFSFYPLPPQLDANGNDINTADKTNFIAIASRLSTRFYAPDVFNAKSSAYIEFDFTGSQDASGFRLRQAYANLAWEKSNLLMGRTWHPMSSGCVPNVVALNTGAPFFAFNRSDQIKFDYKPKNMLLSASAIFQSGYANTGPVGKSANYMRDAVLPEFTIHAAYKTPSFQLGAIGSVKTIKPRLFTMPDYTLPNIPENKFNTDEKLTTYAAQAYAQYQKANWSLKAQATYAQNTTESLMLGGYAVSSIDLMTGHETYTPTQHMNYWVNVDYGKKWQVGLFAGYLDNLGTLENVVEGTDKWYARANDIKYMYRISPHLFYNVNNWQFAAELEYTTAAFGTVQNDQKGKVIDASEISNFRSNLMVCFYF